MNFLADAQLPRRLAHLLAEAGHDAVHTLDLPRGNRTPDQEVCEICLRDNRVLVTKDSDFTNSFLLRRSRQGCYSSRLVISQTMSLRRSFARTWLRL